MTQEDKHLLLVDLCARLPYGTICEDIYGNSGLLLNLVPELNSVTLKISELGSTWTTDIDNIKPYLRPMSSMTEEEKEYIKNRWCYSDWDIAGPSSLWREKIEVEDAEWIIDYFNEHHFDYRNLIFKGLALEAPEGMY